MCTKTKEYRRRRKPKPPSTSALVNIRVSSPKQKNVQVKTTLPKLFLISKLALGSLKDLAGYLTELDIQRKASRR